MSSKISLDLSDGLEVLFDVRGEDPHRLLFLAVIFQAILDATKPEADNESAEAILERDRARGWFFAVAGVTATDFQTICDFAGVDAENIRSLVRQSLTEDTVFIRKKINSILNH